MKTGTKIALVVGGLVLVGGGIALAMGRKKTTIPVRQQPEEQPEPQPQESETKKKKKGALLPVLGGLVVAGGTYLAIKKKNKTGDAFTIEETDDTFGYV